MSPPRPLPSRSGYSLLEILPTLSLLAALAIIVILSLNPKKQFEDARNAKRHTDLFLIADALASHARETNGGVISQIPVLPTPALEICRGAPAANCLSLDPLLGVYLDAIPTDPLAPPEGQTRYFLSRLSIQHFTVSAPDTEPAGSPALQVTQ